MKVKFKVVFAVVFIFGYICAFLYCEWIISYFVLVQCDWPSLDSKNEDLDIESTGEEPVRALVFADTQLVGPNEGSWIDKVRTDWQMYQVFRIAMQLHQPELVFVLGDLTTEGEYCSDAEFDDHVRRFYNLFPVPDGTQMHLLVGNHDIGFHYHITPHFVDRFNKGFNSSNVKLITVRGNHFVLINSVALEGDGCFLCSPTELQLAKIENILKCTKGELSCNPEVKLNMYSKPILLQHFPLYRESDENCHEPDEAPYPEKIEKFKEAWDCVSKAATNKLLRQISPRFVLCGHTHHGCTRDLPDGNGIEVTLPSFNWRYKSNPSYGLLVTTSNNYAFAKCLMPTQTWAIVRYILFGGCLLVIMICWYCQCRRTAKSMLLRGTCYGICYLTCLVVLHCTLLRSQKLCRRNAN